MHAKSVTNMRAFEPIRRSMSVGAFQFSVPPLLKYGDVFNSSEGCAMSVVGYMQRRPTYSVLAVPQNIVDSTIASNAYKYFATKFVLKQPQRDADCLGLVNIRKYGPLPQHFRCRSCILLQDGQRRGAHPRHCRKRRIKLIDDTTKRAGAVGPGYFFSLGHQAKNSKKNSEVVEAVGTQQSSVQH